MDLINFTIPSWRPECVIYAYAQLTNGKGTHKEILESYIDIVKKRNHTVPDKKNILQGIKDETHRLSNDSIMYEKNGWNYRRPNILQKFDRGLWGIRSEIYSNFPQFSS